jgi:hypothetical protein
VPSSGTDAPYVWAIDAEHAPSYWFPRDCPRVTFWGKPSTGVEAALLAGARRVHAVEWGWLRRIRDAKLYRYAFDADGFAPHDPTAGYHVADHPVRPLRVESVGDLLDAHAAAGIELRLVPSLWPLHDAVPATTLAFSIIRMRNATPR